MSTVKLVYHIVFATWHRHKTISASHEKALYAFINNFSHSRGVKCMRIGGMPDHVHILCHLPPMIALSDFLRTLKAESSKFLAQHKDFPYWEKWGAGYYASTVDPHNTHSVYEYIKSQKEHHATKPFADEYREFLKSLGLDNELYILGDN